MTTDPRREYAASFLEESLGLPKGGVEPRAVPTDFVDRLAAAMKGAENARSPEPELETAVIEVGRDIIQSILETDGVALWKERWPQGVKYAACLTHDVDNLTRPVSHILRRRERFSTFDLLLAVTGLRNPYDNISFVKRMEEVRDLRSSFYFLSEHYDLRLRARELASFQRLGWDIGLHGDFGTHDSAEKMSKAIARIKEMTGISPAGVREHYLRFDFGSTWEIMQSAGLAYDSTVGNTDSVGFRIGLCNPFHPPDKDWKPLELLEIPLVLMDVTLWGYLRRSEEEGVRDFQNLRRSVEGVNGLFTILWHPEAVRMKGGKIYAALLDTLRNDKCFVGSGAAMADWWHRRGMPLVKEGKTFRMEDAPAGLVLRFKAKGGEAARITKGATSLPGDSTAIRANGGPLGVTIG